MVSSLPISGDQRVCRRPRRTKWPAHVEQVDEVAAEVNLEIDFDGGVAVVDDVVVLVNALAHDAIETQMDSVGRHAAECGVELLVLEFESGRERLHWRRVDEDRLRPRQRDCILRQHPRVGHEISVLLAGVQARLGVRHHDVVVGVDCYPGGSNRDARDGLTHDCRLLPAPMSRPPRRPMPVGTRAPLRRRRRRRRSIS
jgi:hypothetical protein